MVPASSNNGSESSGESSLNDVPVTLIGEPFEIDLEFQLQKIWLGSKLLYENQ